MAIDMRLVQHEPIITVSINGHNGVLSVDDGEDEHYSSMNSDALYDTLIARVFQIAREVGRPVYVAAYDERGSSALAASPQGEIEPYRVPDESGDDAAPFQTTPEHASPEHASPEHPGPEYAGPEYAGSEHADPAQPGDAEQAGAEPAGAEALGVESTQVRPAREADAGSTPPAGEQPESDAVADWGAGSHADPSAPEEQAVAQLDMDQQLGEPVPETEAAEDDGTPPESDTPPAPAAAEPEPPRVEPTLISSPQPISWAQSPPPAAQPTPEPHQAPAPQHLSQQAPWQQTQVSDREPAPQPEPWAATPDPHAPAPSPYAQGQQNGPQAGHPAAGQHVSEQPRPVSAQPALYHSPQIVAREQEPAAGGVPDDRPSFITTGRSVQPASQGWRKVANGMGMRLSPGQQEVAFRSDVAAVSRHWPGTRTVAVVNPKGSASKTPTVACLSAVFARFGGAGVLAWDNNETEGTLRYRTEWSAHGASLLHLLPRVDQLLLPTAPMAQISNFVHHQPADKYDVLWSDPTVDGDHVVSADDVEKVHPVAARNYRMIVMDSGNNTRAPNWRAMIAHADAIVIPCTEVEDTAEVGARLLETLTRRGGHSADLARNALVLVSHRTEKGKNAQRIADGFNGLARAVVQIPYDPSLETGVIRHDQLRKETQRAWLAAGAALAEAL